MGFDNDFYREIVEKHDDLVITFDTDFTIIYVNQSYCNFFGKSNEELSGNSFLPLIHESDRKKITDSLHSITYENPKSTHIEKIELRNSIHYLKWNTKGVFDNSKHLKYYIGIGLDVTTEENYRLELETTKERYLQAELIGQTGNWEYNIKEKTFWGSDGSKKIYGLDQEEEAFTAETVESRIPDRKNIHQRLLDLIEKNEIYDLEFRILPKNQTEPRMISSKAVTKKDASGNVCKVIGVIHDITKRYTAEQELKASEYRFRKLIDVAPEAVYLISETGHVTDVNSKACEMLGKTRRELLNSMIGDIDPNFPKENFYEFWNKIPIDKTTIFSTTHKHKDGHLIPIEIAGVKFLLENQIHYYGLARDITDRIEMEERLRTSEERFKLAVEGTKDGLWDWDLRTNEAYHSDQFAEMLGYKPEELPYTSEAWSALLHPDDIEKASKKVEDYLNGKTKEYVSTFRMKCKEGYYRWITGRGKAIRDENGKPYRFIGFNTDITKRKNVERSFIQSEEKFHRLFDTMREGVIFYNQDGYIIDANNAAEDILGTSLVELRGKRSLDNVWHLINEDGTKLLEQDFPIIRTLREGIVIDEKVIGVFNPKKNERIWIQVNAIPIYEKGSDQPAKAYAVFQDMSQNRKFIQELENMNQTLQIAQNMAKIGYWRINVKTKSIFWSDQMFDIFGLENKGKSPSIKVHNDFIHPEDIDFMKESINKCFAGEKYDIIIRFYRADGEERLLHSQGHPRFDESNNIKEIFGTSQDVTDLKKTENELKKYQEQLEKLIKDRTIELEEKNEELLDINKTFVGREFRIKELREEVKKLKKELAEYKY